MTQAPPPADMKMQRSSRDASTLPARLAEWLATVLPAGADPVVTLHSGVDANGMSSETLDPRRRLDRGRRAPAGEYVARVAPAADDLPVFPNYALQDQYDAMRIVGEQTDVPVPAVRWMEPTGEVLGTPFFLMDRIDGVVPQDVLPYNFGDNWLHDASLEDQRRLERSSVEVLAKLHAIPDAATHLRLPRAAPRGRRRCWRSNLARTRAWYDFAVPDIGRSPMVERALAWLEANLPETDETVLCWGDSRIGNMMYRDFEPVAVLDWEMAAIGPRELDVSLDRLRAPGLRVDHRHARDARHAALPARGGRGRGVRGDRGRRARRPALVPRLQRRPVGDRLHAHRRPPDPLRRDRAARGHRVALPPQAAPGAAPRARQEREA